MGLTKYRLGDLIERSSEKNIDVDNKYNEEDVRGISNLKEFMITKANLSNRKLDNFLIVPNNHFAFNRRTTRMGEKFAIAFNNTNEAYIVTSDYVVFSVKIVDVLLPSFLYIYFNRPEFDRYVRWESWGSSTEFFNWEQICDIEIKLPSIEIQKKYVAIYQAMLKNQEAYEEGLEDLLFAKEIFLDKLKLNSPYTSIGKFIKQTDIRNKEFNNYPLKGLSMENYFIDSIAKKEGLDLSNYKIVRPDEFACVLMKVGRDVRLTVALNNSCDYFLISPAYYSFQVSGIDRNYFMAFVSRSEFERRAWFSCDTSARGSLSWEEFINLKIPESSNYNQKIISKLSLALLEKQEINEKLKEQIKSICPILIKGAMEEACREGV